MNFETAIVKYLCPICGKVAQEDIIMNSKLTQKYAEEVKKLHNKVVGYADHSCEECAKHKDDCVYFIGVDETKSDFSSFDKIWRTGQIIGIKKDSEFTKQFENYLINLKDNTKLCFIDEKAGNELKLW